MYWSNASTVAFTCCNAQMRCCYTIQNFYPEACELKRVMRISSSHLHTLWPWVSIPWFFFFYTSSAPEVLFNFLIHLQTHKNSTFQDAILLWISWHPHPVCVWRKHWRLNQKHRSEICAVTEAWSTQFPVLHLGAITSRQPKANDWAKASSVLSSPTYTHTFLCNSPHLSSVRNPLGSASDGCTCVPKGLGKGKPADREGATLLWLAPELLHIDWLGYSCLTMQWTLHFSML